MSTLHVFNPDHDYALAVGENVYVSPGKIRKIAADMQYLPRYWAGPEDYILLADNMLYSIAEERVAPLSEADGKIEKIFPWGWDHTLVMRLRALGIPERLLPCKEKINEMRRLSHRRISIDLNRVLGSRFIPRECKSVEEAKNFLQLHPYAFFKAPWSSSGRGIVNSRRMPAENLFAWIKGIINKQGSVLAEKGAEKRLDFATLWWCKNDSVEFCGFSLTEADDKGQYLGNYYGPQSRLKEAIKKETDEDLDEAVQLQKAFLRGEVLPFYEGPLGIDMVIDDERRIWPAIELNLRNTMGHAALNYQRFIDKNGQEEALNPVFTEYENRDNR